MVPLPMPMFVYRVELVMEVGYLLIVITFVIKIRMTVVNKFFLFNSTNLSIAMASFVFLWLMIAVFGVFGEKNQEKCH